MGAAIVQWISLGLPIFHPAIQGSNRIHNIFAFSIYVQILNLSCHCIVKRTKMKQKGPGLAH